MLVLALVMFFGGLIMAVVAIVMMFRSGLGDVTKHEYRPPQQSFKGSSIGTSQRGSIPMSTAFRHRPLLASAGFGGFILVYASLGFFVLSGFGEAAVPKEWLAVAIWLSALVWLVRGYLRFRK